MKDWKTWAVHGIAGNVIGLATVAFFGCARPPSPATVEAATYGAELEACALQSSTCPGYVMCRQRVAASHGRTYSGRCVP